MPSYTTANLSFNAPFVFKKQSFNARLDILNLANAQNNEFEYISSGGYFSELFPTPTTSGLRQRLSRAPRMIYGRSPTNSDGLVRSLRRGRVEGLPGFHCPTPLFSLAGFSFHRASNGRPSKILDRRAASRLSIAASILMSR